MYRRVVSRSVWPLLIIVALSFGLLPAGCGKPAQLGTGQDSTGQPPINPNPAETKTTVTLYFSDDQAMYLVPERREVVRKGEPVEEIVIRELIKGPAKPELRQTVPPETRLLSLSIASGVAYVNFSGEVQNRRYGGSAGEGLLLYAVVNSLAELPGINKVQFLVEGNKLETLFGHIEIMEPLGPSWSMVKGEKVKLGPVAVDFRRAQELQNSVDNGHQPWRLDPVQVVLEEGRQLGFDPTADRFSLLSKTPVEEGSGTGVAIVEAVQNNKAYLVQLVQPVKQGNAGIWAIKSVQEK